MCDSCCRDVESRLLFDDEGAVEGMFCDSCIPPMEQAYALGLAPTMVVRRPVDQRRSPSRPRKASNRPRRPRAA